MKLQKYLFLPALLIMLAVVSMAFVNDAAQFEALPGDHEITTVAADAKLALLDGEEIYMTRCLSCHMANGEGVPGVFPPLAESEYVTGDKGVLVRMILNGLSGEITVNNVTYSGMMPPWGTFLNDQQVSEVLTYVRSSFGNDADAISANEVARVRAKVADRKDTWTMEELTKDANRGIPDGD